MGADPWQLEEEQRDLWDLLGADVESDEMCAVCERFSRPPEGCPACGTETGLDGPERRL